MGAVVNARLSENSSDKSESFLSNVLRRGLLVNNKSESSVGSDLADSNGSVLALTITKLTRDRG